MFKMVAFLEENFQLALKLACSFFSSKRSIQIIALEANICNLNLE